MGEVTEAWRSRSSRLSTFTLPSLPRAAPRHERKDGGVEGVSGRHGRKGEGSEERNGRSLVPSVTQSYLFPFRSVRFLSFPITSEPVFSRLRRRLRRDVMGNDPRKLRQVVRILILQSLLP